MKSKRNKRRSSKKSLLKKIKGSPLNGTLITPVPCGRSINLSVGAVNYATSDDIDAVRGLFFIPGWIDNLSEEQKARELGITIGADFMQEFGDFDVFGYWRRKLTLWQRLWLRFRIWRMRRKVRKVLQQR